MFIDLEEPRPKCLQKVVLLGCLAQTTFSQWVCEVYVFSWEWYYEYKYTCILYEFVIVTEKKIPVYIEISKILLYKQVFYAM